MTQKNDLVEAKLESARHPAQKLWEQNQAPICPGLGKSRGDRSNKLETISDSYAWNSVSEPA